MGAYDEPLLGFDQGRDVLRRVTRCVEERHRRRTLEILGAIAPNVILVYRSHIVETRAPKERGVQRVVRVMMVERDVGDVVLVDAQLVQRIEQHVAVGRHPRIYHDYCVTFADQDDGAGHAVIRVAIGKYVDDS